MASVICPRCKKGNAPGRDVLRPLQHGTRCDPWNLEEMQKKKEDPETLIGYANWLREQREKN